MLTDAQRTNARTMSNTLSAQIGVDAQRPRVEQLHLGVGAVSGPRHGPVDDVATAPRQRLGADRRAGPGDPLGPNPIAFTRSNFVINGAPRADQRGDQLHRRLAGVRLRARRGPRRLRTGGGTGAKLLTSANNLLPYNTAGLPNQNNGPTPANQLFLAGDIRANENLLLTSMQTVFMREHNRLVDLIAVQQPGLNAEQQYQLARKIVGAEIQAITYKEFLPALMGSAAPTVQGYHYARRRGRVDHQFVRPLGVSVRAQHAAVDASRWPTSTGRASRAR